MSVMTLPFACTWPDGSGALEDLNGKRVTQCALSRVCGSCGRPLGRPIAFIGTAEEVARNAFHFPPLHVGCAQSLLPQVTRARAGVLGQDHQVDRWSVVTTAGFEFVRPGRDEPETRPTFQPNSLL